MRILQVTNSFKYAWERGGGHTRVAYDVSANLVERGHSVTVFTTEEGLPAGIDIKRNHPIDMDGMEVYYFSNASDYLAKREISIPYRSPGVVRKRLKEFDVIHLHEYRRSFTPLIHHYARKYGIPYVLQPHNSVATYFQKATLKRIFDKLWGYRILKDAAMIIAVSREEVTSLERIGIGGQRVTLIYNGMDINSFDNHAKPGKFKEQHGISGKLILYLGRITQTKGIGIAIRAFSGLRNEPGQLTFVIAGADDGYQAELERLVSELDLGNSVQFTGPLSEEDKILAYADADLFIHAVGYMGGVGLTPLEAILCDTPVIVTEECGEVIKEADCGYFVEYGDVSDLESKMRRALENPEEGKEMVERGKKYIHQNLTWETAVDKMEAVYHQALRGKRSLP